MQSSSGTRVGFALHKSRSYLKASDSQSGHIRFEAPRFVAVRSLHAGARRTPSHLPSFDSRRENSLKTKLLTRSGRSPAFVQAPRTPLGHIIPPDTSVVDDGKTRVPEPSTVTKASHNIRYGARGQDPSFTRESGRFQRAGTVEFPSYKRVQK